MESYRLDDFAHEEEKTLPALEIYSTEPQKSKEKIKHLLIGSPAVVHRTIQILHTKGYSEANSWSKPVLAGGLGDKDGDVLVILIKNLLMG